jgi:hypothetical protein
MVQTFGSRRSHPSLRDGIGSGRPERCTDLPYSKTLHATIEVRAIAAVAIVNQESRWRLIPGAACHDFLVAADEWGGGGAQRLEPALGGVCA